MKYKFNDIILTGVKRIVQPYSWVGHIPFAFWIMDELKPKTFVELGTHTGNSYFSFCQAARETNSGTKCYAVDTWKGDDHAGYYDAEVYEDVSAYNSANYASESILIKSKFDNALDRFENGSIDLLHIDGLHTYEAVKKDYEAWLPKMSKRGVILFHDTYVKENGFGVWRLWSELEGRYPSIEFKHSHGLGVLLVGENVPQSVISFCEMQDEELQIHIKLFEKIGAGIIHEILVKDIDHLKEINENLQHQSTELLNEREALIQERDSLAEERNKLLSMVHQMENSISWKLAGPIRRVSNAFLKKKVG